MTAGYVGNRHPGLGGFGQYRQLLIQRVTPPTLDAGKNFDSINTGHSRMTRLTPSPSLCSYVRFKWGPFQAIIHDARAAGYATMRLDTSWRQREAQTLYSKLGFRRIDPYYDCPSALKDWLVFFELSL